MYTTTLTTVILNNHYLVSGNWFESFQFAGDSPEELVTTSDCGKTWRGQVTDREYCNDKRLWIRNCLNYCSEYESFAIQKRIAEQIRRFPKINRPQQLDNADKRKSVSWTFSSACRAAGIEKGQRWLTVDEVIALSKVTGIHVRLLLGY